MNRGSLRWHEIRASTARCFNEAPIHESGKLQGTRRPGQADPDASMRPRFMNRGSRLRGVVMDGYTQMLQ